MILITITPERGPKDYLPPLPVAAFIRRIVCEIIVICVCVCVCVCVADFNFVIADRFSRKLVGNIYHKKAIFSKSSYRLEK